MSSWDNIPTPVLSPEYPPLKRVRIALPPSPPPDIPLMEDNATPRRWQTTTGEVQGGDRVVLPSDRVQEAEEQLRLRSGSKWKQHDLKLLKVRFEPNEEADFPVLAVESNWTPSLSQRILFFLAMLTRQESRRLFKNLWRYL
jgi:hypothetical protein